jgi:phage baseplate assembly protein W
MNAAKLFGKGISFPPRVGPDGRIVWSDGDVNVRESIQIILTTDQNERLMQPDFGGGLGLFLFEPNTVTTRHLIQDRIVKTLAQWEPRIVVESVDVVPDADNLRLAIATITYRLIATQARERVSLNVTLANA